MELNQTTKEFLAGSFGGIAQVLSGQPFDTVKVRLQTQPEKYPSMLACIKKTYINDSFSGFYKGTLTPLIGIGACVSIQFAALDYAKRFFNSNNKGNQLTVPQFIASGSFAGICNSVLCCPIEHTRIRLQTQNTLNGPLHFLSDVYSKYGIRGVFKGQVSTSIREAIGFGLGFGSYEALIQRECNLNNCQRKDVSISKQMFYGAISGYCFWIIAYPIDVIKSKIQTDSLDFKNRKFTGIVDCFKQTYKVDKVKGFYRGLSTSLLRAAPVNAITFVAYEFAMNCIGR